MLERVIEKIRTQQGEERTPVWMVGEQLIDICRHEPECAEILLQDLENETLSLANAEKKIKAFADGHKTGGFACVTPIEADRILREFYGLPQMGEAPGPAVKSLPPVLDLSEFL
jgi:hypothetical protein